MRGCCDGFDADPALAAAAGRLRQAGWPASIDLVRFTHPGSGIEQWLGWDARTASWRTWDDPRAYYPGHPGDVLDPGGHAEPVGGTDAQLSLEVHQGSPLQLDGDPPEPSVAENGATIDLGSDY